MRKQLRVKYNTHGMVKLLNFMEETTEHVLFLRGGIYSLWPESFFAAKK